MPELKQRGTVKAGRFIPEAPGVWAANVRDFEGKRVEVVMRTEKKAKTLAQLGYYRGFILPFFVEQWSREKRYPQGLPPYDPEDIHELLVKHTIGYQEEPGPLGEPMRKKTADSDVPEMSKLIDGCIALAFKLWGSVLPGPGEAGDVTEAF